MVGRCKARVGNFSENFRRKDFFYSLVSRLEGARYTFQVTHVMPQQYINLQGNVVSKIFDVEPLIVIHHAVIFMDALRAA